MTAARGPKSLRAKMKMRTPEKSVSAIGGTRAQKEIWWKCSRFADQNSPCVRTVRSPELSEGRIVISGALGRIRSSGKAANILVGGGWSMLIWKFALAR